MLLWKCKAWGSAWELLAPSLNSPLDGLGWKVGSAAPLMSYLFCTKGQMETVSLLEIPLKEITGYFTVCLHTRPSGQVLRRLGSALNHIL